MGQLYRKKPIAVDAEQFAGSPATACRGVNTREDGSCYVETIEGNKVAVVAGTWIMSEGDGVHYYPCADEVFRRTYERYSPPIQYEFQPGDYLERLTPGGTWTMLQPLTASNVAWALERIKEQPDLYRISRPTVVYSAGG